MWFSQCGIQYLIIEATSGVKRPTLRCGLEATKVWRDIVLPVYNNPPNCAQGKRNLTKTCLFFSYLLRVPKCSFPVGPCRMLERPL